MHGNCYIYGTIGQQFNVNVGLGILLINRKLYCSIIHTLKTTNNNKKKSYWCVPTTYDLWIMPLIWPYKMLYNI